MVKWKSSLMVKIANIDLINGCELLGVRSVGHDVILFFQPVDRKKMVVPLPSSDSTPTVPP